MTILNDCLNYLFKTLARHYFIPDLWLVIEGIPIHSKNLIR